MKAQLRLIFLFLIITLISCGGSDLTRSDAEVALKKFEGLNWMNLRVRAADLDAFSKEGFEFGGQEVWDTVVKSMDLDKDGRRDVLWLTLVKPITYTIEVTGIAKESDGSTARTVNFRWSQVGLPTIVKRFAVDGGTGQAIFRIYDDGWRVEKVNALVSEDIFKLSDEEISELESYKEQRRQRVLVEKEKEQKRYEEQEARYMEAIKPSEPLMSVQGRRISSGLWFDYTVIVSENFIVIESKPSYEKTTLVTRIPFANIRGINTQFRTSFVVDVFCRNGYPGTDFALGRNGQGAGANISEEDISGLVDVATTALSNWRQKHGEFYGTDWQAVHYHKTCT